MIGAAIHNAATLLKEKVFAVAGHLLEAAPADLQMEESVVSVVGTPSKSVTLTDVEPLVRFVESTMPSFPGVPVGPVLDRVRQRVTAAIGAAGAFRFRSHTGFLVCR